MADSIGQAYVQILPTTKGFSNKLTSELGGGSAGSALTGAGKKMGGKLMAGMAAVGIGALVVKGIKDTVNAVKGVAEVGDNIDKMSQKMGISAKAYQEWDAVMKHSGTTIDALKPSMKILANQAQKNASEFQKLGISQKEVSTLSQEDLFSRTIEGLQKMEQGTERTALTSKLLGRGSVELGALLNTSAEKTQAMKDRVHELGGVMSDEAVKASARFKDQLQDMNTAMDGLKRNLLSQFMPGLTTVMGGLTNIFSGDVKNGTEQIKKGFENITQTITTAIPTFLNVGAEIIISIGKSIAKNLPTIIPALAQVALKIGEGIVKSAPQLLQSGITVLIELGKGLIQGLPKLLPMVAKVVTDLALMLTEPSNLTNLIMTGLELVVAIADGLGKAAPVLIGALPELITNIVSTLIKLAPKLLIVSVKLVATLAKGLIAQGAALLKSGTDLFNRLKEKFDSFKEKFINIGRNIIDGIKQGLQNAKDKLLGKIKEIAGLLPDAVKKLLKIGSPSKVFADEVGKWIPAGIAMGIEHNASVVDDAMEGIIRKPMFSTGMRMDISATDNTAAMSYANIYNAIKQGASEAQPVVILNGRVLSRELKGMGVSFA